MIWDDDHPPGFLGIVAGILLAMTVNAGILTVRDLSGVDLRTHPLTALAFCVAIVGAGFAVAALHPAWRVACVRGVALTALAASVLAAVFPGDVVVRSGVPWILHLGFVGMIAGAISLRGPWFAGFCVLILASQWRLTPPSPRSDSLLLIVALGVASAGFIKSQVVRLTVATREANERAAAASVERTRATAVQAAHDQWTAWVHDHLLVVFRLGSQRSSAAGELARELLDTGLSRPGVEASDLRRAAFDVAAGQGVRLRWDVLSEGPPPATVNQALESAVGEAIRNAARHSGATLVTVSGEVGPVRCHVTVTDAGSGFDATAPPTGRMGIPTSIVAQLGAVGGRAQVLSEPGAGTQVRLSWEPAIEPDVAPEFPLGWLVVAAAGVSALSAARAWLALGPDADVWVLAGFAIVITLTVVTSVCPRTAAFALASWLVAEACLAAWVPETADRESRNWFAVGSAVVYIAVARVRRERLGLAFALAALLVNLVLGATMRPQDLVAGIAYWIQPPIYAALAWLGITRFEQLFRRYQEASRRAVALEEAVITGRAERDESERWLAGMPSEVIPLLEELATTAGMDADLARRCALAEAATRDHLTASLLVNPQLAVPIRSMRERGAYVSLSDGGPRTPTAQLRAVRACLSDLAPIARSSSRVTVHWTVNDSACFATLTITRPARRPNGVATPPDTEVLANADVVHVRFLSHVGMRSP
ncbi:MAG: hypothetical protein LCH96_02985 [Actinobacteria bacterium]|nr:hypothetical protein [Actinomycetota bacterium]